MDRNPTRLAWVGLLYRHAFVSLLITINTPDSGGLWHSEMTMREDEKRKSKLKYFHRKHHKTLINMTDWSICRQCHHHHQDIFNEKILLKFAKSLLKIELIFHVHIFISMMMMTMKTTMTMRNILTNRHVSTAWLGTFFFLALFEKKIFHPHHHHHHSHHHHRQSFFWSNTMGALNLYSKTWIIRRLDHQFAISMLISHQSSLRGSPIQPDFYLTLL